MISSDLETESPGPGPEATVRASLRVFSGHLGAPPLSSGRHLVTRHQGHHPWALAAGWQARPAGAHPERRCRGALKICPRGTRRQVGPGLGFWLCPNSSLKPGAHNPRSSKSLDRRRLPAVVQSRVFGCVEGGVSKPAQEGSLSPRRGF